MKKIILIFIILLSNVTILKAATLKNSDQEIKIVVKNSENKEYILDILFYEEEKGYENIIPHLSASELEKANIIKNYLSEDNFNNSLLRGSIEKLEGNLKGTQLSHARKIHSFIYDTFQEDGLKNSNKRKINNLKIIIVDNNNKVMVSEELEIKQFSSLIEYDFSTNTAKVQSPSLDIIIFTIFSVVISLFFSFVLFIKMKFDMKNDLVKFATISSLTSITTTILTANALYIDNALFAFYTLLIVGFLSIVIQVILLASYKKNKRSFLFGIISPLINIIVTFMILLLI